MQKEYIRKFPKWCLEQKNEYGLVLTNDIDSLLSCFFLQKIKGYKITHFYDFNTLYVAEDYIKGTPIIGVDMDLTNGRCWGNHVTILSEKDTKNNKAANLNVIDNVTKENYFSKYAGSTLLTILALYNIDISKFDEEAKKILLAIDVAFKGYYLIYPQPQKSNKYYLCEVLQFNDLYKLQQKYDIEQFYDIILKYNLNKQIHTKNGYLKTNINLGKISKIFDISINLPQQKFVPLIKFENKNKSINYRKPTKQKVDDDIFSIALTNRNFCCYSKIRRN